MKLSHTAFAGLTLFAIIAAPTPASAAPIDPAALEKIDTIFADWRVADGKLVHVRGLGVQEFEAKQAVGPDSPGSARADPGGDGAGARIRRRHSVTMEDSAAVAGNALASQSAPD
ncbi:MAG: hypothetical protein H0W71_05070 [Sphingomonas sp.]|nr:hypothetical protein [Sphingomonas sp.]